MIEYLDGYLQIFGIQLEQYSVFRTLVSLLLAGSSSAELRFLDHGLISLLPTPPSQNVPVPVRLHSPPCKRLETSFSYIKLKRPRS